MTTNRKLVVLRKLIRENSKNIIAFISDNYIQRRDDRAVVPSNLMICMFCGSGDNITKEHIMPRWAFEKRTERYFNITLNGIKQTYNKTTIPACRRCNSELLNSLEKDLQKIFTGRDVVPDPFYIDESEQIIRWLEIIDYKFQILNITRKFKSMFKYLWTS